MMHLVYIYFFCCLSWVMTLFLCYIVFYVWFCEWVNTTKSEHSFWWIAWNRIAFANWLVGKFGIIKLNWLEFQMKPIISCIPMSISRDWIGNWLFFLISLDCGQICQCLHYSSEFLRSMLIGCIKLAIPTLNLLLLLPI